VCGYYSAPPLQKPAPKTFETSTLVLTSTRAGVMGTLFSVLHFFLFYIGADGVLASIGCLYGPLGRLGGFDGPLGFLTAS
jgi:hypothetical protein